MIQWLVFNGLHFSIANLFGVLCLMPACDGAPLWQSYLGPQEYLGMVTEGIRKRKRKRSVRKPEAVYYVLEISGWEWSFSFGINSMKYRDDPYSDFRHLHLYGELMRPTNIKPETARLILLPDERYNRDARERHTPISVGSLSLHRGLFEGLLSIPADSLSSLLAMLTANKFKFAVLNGDRLRYGRAPVRNFRLEMRIDEDDLPLED
jgi:hypothetical protein